MKEAVADYIRVSLSKFIDKPWALGVKDRGHGHRSYAVVAIVQDSNKDNSWIPRPVVLETGTDAELAEYIVELHNERLGGAGTRLARETELAHVRGWVPCPVCKVDTCRTYFSCPICGFSH